MKSGHCDPVGYVVKYHCPRWPYISQFFFEKRHRATRMDASVHGFSADVTIKYFYIIYIIKYPFFFVLALACFGLLWLAFKDWLSRVVYRMVD